MKATSDYTLHPTGTLRLVPDMTPSLVLDEGKVEELVNEMTGVIIGILVVVVAASVIQALLLNCCTGNTTREHP